MEPTNIIKGDSRAFLVINTAEYNNDGRWVVQAVRLDELAQRGFVYAEIQKIDSLEIGWEMRDFDYTGVIVIRIA